MNENSWLSEFVADVARAITVTDARAPVWTSATTRNRYQPGIGPHPETETVRLVTEELSRSQPGTYGQIELNVPYPADPKKRCDLLIEANPRWAIEVKMLRLMGDNGKLNDNMLMHILSPYPIHRSALTDCEKLVESGFVGKLSVLIYGYDYPSWPLNPAIDAFERLASAKVDLGERAESSFLGLMHPVHQQGRVFAWRVRPRIEV